MKRRPVAIRVFSRIIAVALAGVIATLGGCAADKEPPETSVSWLATQTRAAKPFDCAMPMLKALPDADYQQIAIVEVTDDYSADNQEVYGLVRRKACETGADALVILEDRRQERGKQLPGYSADSASDGGSGGAKDSATEHTPAVGEEGHQGRVVNAVAIIYKRASTASDSSTGGR